MIKSHGATAQLCPLHRNTDNLDYAYQQNAANAYTKTQDSPRNTPHTHTHTHYTLHNTHHAIL